MQGTGIMKYKLHNFPGIEIKDGEVFAIVLGFVIVLGILIFACIKIGWLP